MALKARALATLTAKTPAREFADRVNRSRVDEEPHRPIDSRPASNSRRIEMLTILNQLFDIEVTEKPPH